MLHLNFLNTFETCVRRAPDETCFIDAGCDYMSVTYRQLREDALRLVLELDSKGVRRGMPCAVDMDNCAEFAILLLAAAYGGFSLIVLNTRLSLEEKRDRARELYDMLEVDSFPLLNQETVQELLDISYEDHPSSEYANTLAQAVQRALASADDRASATIMFTSGTQGHPKAANLTWGNLLGAASSANTRLSPSADAVWQLALPLFHVGGIAVMLRSLLAGSRFILYPRFDAYTVLRDAKHFDATHISVVDKMLQDLLACAKESKDNHQPELAALDSYECILLGGGAVNPETLKKALRAKANVHVSYGQTETSSMVASERALKGFDGYLLPLPGYELAVLDADDTGLGKLAVKGPGVFSGYLNARASFTGDGFFLTGDSATRQGSRIRVAERTEDMFVSGGENIYPEEIRMHICRVPGVSDAYVFGVANDLWGRRPIAFVERASDEELDLQELTESVRTSLSMRLSKVYIPDQIIALDEFPRTDMGKIDRRVLHRLYERRIQVESVEMWRISQPFASEMRTAKAQLRARESLIVQVTCAGGATGIGEDVAFSSSWYLPETIDDDIAYIRRQLLPALLHQPFLTPQDAAQFIEDLPGSQSFPLACAALENALWDAYGKGVKSSIAKLIGARKQVSESGAIHKVPKGCVPGGAVVGLCSPKEIVSKVAILVDAGYTRVKMKIEPGHDFKQVKAVREAFPLLSIALDANQSYKDSQVDMLRALAEFKIDVIEEPLHPSHKPSVGPTDLYDRLARLQDSLPMPICLDESWTNVGDLVQALAKHPELRHVSVKIGKFGGLQQALDFYTWAREKGISMWIGGMYDTGVSKRLHAAFGMLPGIQLPGDISSTSRYFTRDICKPPFELEDGMMLVNPEGYEYGLGCELDYQALDELAIDHWVIE